MLKITRVALLCALVLSSAVVGAETLPRETMIEKIVAAKGISETLDTQLNETRDALDNQFKDIFDSEVTNNGYKPTAQDNALLNKYLLKTQSLFTTKELHAQWTEGYTKDLSDADLEAILAHYESDAGKKEVSSSKAASARFVEWISDQYQVRADLLAEEFVKELRKTRPQSTGSNLPSMAE